MNNTADNLNGSPTLIIAAMHCELAATVKTLDLSPRQGWYCGQYNNQPVIAAVVGIGGKQAGLNTERLIKQHHPRAIILIGFAGGLDPSLAAGAIIAPQCVIDEHGRAMVLAQDGTVTESTGDAGPGLTLLSVDAAVCEGSQKAELFARYHAAAVDMETFTVAKLAGENRIPLYVRRVISDTADQDLPAEVLGWTSQDGQALPLKVMGDLLCHPHLLKVTLRLAKTSRQASQSLADEAVRLLT